jgi:hypothetical protein
MLIHTNNYLIFSIIILSSKIIIIILGNEIELKSNLISIFLIENDQINKNKKEKIDKINHENQLKLEELNNEIEKTRILNEEIANEKEKNDRDSLLLNENEEENKIVVGKSPLCTYQSITYMYIYIYIYVYIYICI